VYALALHACGNDGLSLNLIMQALHLKTADSAALPIYQTLPEQPQRIEASK